MTLHLLLREHRLALPDDPELLEELATVRLRESTPGVYRLDHDASGHDDRAVALGLAALGLTERAEGRGSITVPGSDRAAGRIDERTNVDARPSLPKSAAVRAAAEAMPRGLPAARCCCPAQQTTRSGCSAPEAARSEAAGCEAPDLVMVMRPARPSTQPPVSRTSLLRVRRLCGLPNLIMAPLRRRPTGGPGSTPRPPGCSLRDQWSCGCSSR